MSTEAPDEKQTALGALRATLNPTLHTDNCMEMRAAGVRRCTHVCASVRAAVERLTGEPLAGADWPGVPAPDQVPDACPSCGGVFHFGAGGYCPKCGAPFLMTDDPSAPHRIHMSVSVSTADLPGVLRGLRTYAAGRQPSFAVTTITPAEEASPPRRSTSVSSPEELIRHDDHEIEVVSYGDGANVAVECKTCHEVLIDANRPGANEDPEDDDKELYEAIARHAGQEAEILDGADRAEIRCAECHELIYQIKS